ncbi:MAG: APC family permease, partial [Kiloniellaceae bacterium]
MPQPRDTARPNPSRDEPRLKRTLSLPMILLYGLGTTIGAGVYALLGAVVAHAGVYAPVSFLVASVLAGLSAMSFAELAARFPTSAGEARYVREGLRSPALALAVGGLVIFAGIVSSAAVANGFAGYFQDLTGAAHTPTIAGLVILLFVVAAWGIGESVLVAALMTVIEIGGLLLVIWVARDAMGAPAGGAAGLVPPLEATVWIGIMAGSFLAFFAFIGFEDMVNVAEEVKNAPRVLPMAIGLTLVLTLALYLALATVAVRAVPIADLTASDA